MLYPINLKIDDMKVTIVGGGKVAYRKCMNFLAFNKKVTVIATDFIEEFENIKEDIEIIKHNYEEKYIEDSYIVIGATNNKKINEEIGIYCRKNNKLVNIVDNPKLCNFTVPSYIKRGDLLLSISTGGKSPSLSAKIRKELEEVYDESYEEYINLLGEARERIIKNISDVEKRREDLKHLLNFNKEELKNLLDK